MNILILSWRDPKHPLAGGAERITLKYAEFWTQSGHQVIWISNAFPGSAKVESVDGVKFIRVSPGLSAHVWLNMLFYPIYLFKVIVNTWLIVRSMRIDKVIDEIHGLPFFTPLFINSSKIIFLVCEFAGSIWDKMFPFPLNLIGRWGEKIIYKLYKKTSIFAISGNTKSDIISLDPKLKVNILPLGIETTLPAGVKIKKRNDYPSAVFVARLVKMKGVEIAIESAEEIVKKLPDFKLFIIGKGEPSYEKSLRNIVEKKKLNNVVKFLGYVSEQEKFKVLSECHFLFHPSYKEGFGLTVLEAGLVGTPAIIKTGSSLDELVTDGYDGYVISSKDEMAERFIDNYSSAGYTKMSQNAKTKAMKYSWDIKLKEATVLI